MTFETLTTERLFLRKLTTVEFKFIFENHSEDQIRKALGITSDAEFLREQEKYKKGSSSPYTSFRLIDKLSDVVIGACGFHNWHPEHRRAEIGYTMTMEEYRGKGLMTEAMKAVLDYGFNTIELNRVEACVGPDNVPSLKLMDKFHFKKEGYLRQHYFNYRDNTLYDSVLFSLLKEEYKK